MLDETKYLDYICHHRTRLPCDQSRKVQCFLYRYASCPLTYQKTQFGINASPTHGTRYWHSFKRYA